MYHRLHTRHTIDFNILLLLYYRPVMPLVESEIVAGSLFRDKRKEMGLTQRALAEKAGISPQTIGDIENDVVFAPRPETLARLRTALQPTEQELQAVHLGETIVFQAPPDNEPGPSTDIATDTVPTRTRNIEQTHAQEGEGFVDILRRLYVDELKSAARVGNLLGVSRDFILKELHRAGLPVRDRGSYNKSSERRRQQGEFMRAFWGDPDQKAMMLSRQRASWQDPDTKKERLSKIHTPQSDRKRSESSRRYYEQHPERLPDLKVHNMKLREQRIAQAFGDNPKAALERLIWEEGLSLGQIGRQVGHKAYTISKWARYLGVKTKTQAEIARGRAHISQADLDTARKAQAAGLLPHLTPAQRIAIEQRFLREDRPMTTRDIAELVARTSGRLVTPQAIGDAQQHALQKLRKLLSKE